MAPISGKEGMVVWTGKLPLNARIVSWSADITVDTFAATGLAATPPKGKQRVVGLQDATGNIAFVADSAGAGEIPGGAAVRLQLKANSAVIYEFDALLTGIHPSCEVEGENVLSYDFEMDDDNGVYITGEPTATPASSPH